MASDAGRQVTLSHQAAQQLLVARLNVELQGLWPMIDWKRLTDTYAAWALAVATTVSRYRLISGRLASAYLHAFRQVEGIPGTAKVVLAEPLPAEQVAASLRATTLPLAKVATGDGPAAAEARTAALSRSTGASGRLVQDAGRKTIDLTVQSDEQAVGWARIVRVGSCAFCAMLATRGPVYKSDHSALFAGDGGRYHDHCTCTAEPLYKGQEYQPQPHIDRLDQLYVESTAGHSGKAAIHAFAKAYREAGYLAE